jgi:hypothetical protein
VGLESAALAHLQQGTGLSLAKLWLAARLGGLEMEQGRGFGMAGVASSF